MYVRMYNPHIQPQRSSTKRNGKSQSRLHANILKYTHILTYIWKTNFLLMLRFLYM